jgi:hypothetical protein
MIDHGQIEVREYSLPVGAGTAGSSRPPVIDVTELAASKQTVADCVTIFARFSLRTELRRTFQMLRTALFLLAATLVSKVGSADDSAPPHRFCNAIPVYNQVQSHLWPASIFDFSHHGDAADPEVTYIIESGGALGELVLGPMELGRTRVSNVALAAPAERLRPILRAISLKFAGERLPYLVFLLIGPPELRGEAQTLIEGMGATFIFVPYEDHVCDSHSASDHSGDSVSQ